MSMPTKADLPLPVIPSVVKVGALTYEVRLVEHPLTIGGKEVRGGIHFDETLIQIRTDCQSMQAAYQTFLHELVHAIVRERGLDWGDNDELYVDEISKGLHQVLVDNSEIFCST